MPETNQSSNITPIEHQLGDLMDRHELVDLVNRLGLILDEKRFDDLRSIYTEDAEGVFPSGAVRGVERLIDQAHRNHMDFDRMQHIFSNVLIDLVDDRATVRANLVATLVRSAETPGASHLDLWAGYRFDAVRTARGWRFSRVELSPVWRFDSLE